MTDEHQINAIIATAIIDSFSDHPEYKIDTEHAKIIAKYILTAFRDANLQVTSTKAE